MRPVNTVNRASPHKIGSLCKETAPDTQTQSLTARLQFCCNAFPRCPLTEGFRLSNEPLNATEIRRQECRLALHSDGLEILASADDPDSFVVDDADNHGAAWSAGDILEAQRR